MSVGLDREQIRLLLDELSAELAARGARADLFGWWRGDRHRL
jgi:hypothetical protein